MDHSAFTYTRTAAADAAEDHCTRASFLDLPLEVLEYILPYLPPQTILSLALVSKSFHRLLFPPVTTSTSSDRKHTLRPWRHLNLGKSYTASLPVKKAPQTSSLLPPSPPPSPPPTFTPAYVHNPESILSKPYILENVRTLILDSLPAVNVSFLEAFFRAGDHSGSVNPLHRTQILSIRGCPQLEDMGLAKTVLRAQDFPKSLKGIYYFSDPDMDFVSPSEGGADVFVSAKMGRTLNSARRRSSDQAGGGWWVETMKMLKGKVAFDAEVCRGKTHFQYDPETAAWQEREPRVASMKLTKGCVGCGAWPESEDHIHQQGSGYGDGDSEVVFPPAPVHSSSLASAKSDRHLRMGDGRVTLRCTECLDKRYCRGCGKWWCTPCAEQPVQPQNNEQQPLASAGALSRRQVVSRDCFECGYLCGECTSVSARECVNCRGCYCVLHNEGSDPQHCEWCIESTSHRRGSVSAVTRVAPGRRSSISITSTTTSTTPPNEVDMALSSIAALTDPSAPSRLTTFTPFSSTSPPTSPHLTAIPQPVILLSSRLPPPLQSSSSSSASSSKLKGKGVGTTDSVTGPPASPILKAMSGKGEVHRAAGMRLRTIIGGVAIGTNVGTGMLGVNAAGSSAGAGAHAHVRPAERAEVDRRMRWLGRE